MNGERLAYAVAAGMAATVNPCGFALLPAYLSYYLGLTDDGPTSGPAAAEGRSSAVLRAIGVGAALTAGFLLVFGIVGTIWSSVSSLLGERLPWVTAAMGVGLVVLGIAMVAGYQPVVRVPKMRVGKGGQEAWSTFLFGISYAVASLSCTLPIFTAVTATSTTDGFVGGVTGFLAYGLGMGLLVTALTLSVALAREGLVRTLRRLLPHMGRISGALLIVAGAFVAYYGWAEAHVVDNAAVVTRLSQVQGSFQDQIDRIGVGRLGLVLAAAIALAAAGAWWVRRRPGAAAVEKSPPPQRETPA